MANVVGSKLILAIDNEDSWLDIAKELLKEHFTLDIAKNYKDAMARLQSDINYDLVLVNINLTNYQDKTGELILEYLRDKCPEIPRIVITGMPFEGPIFAEFFGKYKINELLRKDEFKHYYLRATIYNLLNVKDQILKVTCRQIHNEIPRYIVHSYQRKLLKNYPRLQLFSFLVENFSKDLIDISIIFESHNPYVQETVYNLTLKQGDNQFYFSPIFTGQVGDGGDIAVSKIKIMVEEQCLWKSNGMYTFKVINITPIQLKKAVIMDSWVHFLIAACITPKSDEITKLTNQVLHAWKEKHPGEAWRAGDYSETDAAEVVEFLRNLLKDKLTPQGPSYPKKPDDGELVVHTMLLPDEVIKRGGANCLYYSLVYASVLENLDIDPLLLFIPGHVIPGWKKIRSHLDNTFYKFKPEYFEFLSENTVFIESTLTSYDDTFQEMLRSGKQAFSKAQKLAANDQDVYLLDIAQMRSEGFTPYEGKS